MNASREPNGTYINEHKEWQCLCYLPLLPALAWLNSAFAGFPELTPENYTRHVLNKGYWVVEDQYSFMQMAIYQADGKFYLYRHV